MKPDAPALCRLCRHHIQVGSIDRCGRVSRCGANGLHYEPADQFPEAA